MKVGDLVIRKVDLIHTPLKLRSAQRQRDRLGMGLVLGKRLMGSPRHMCLEVYYSKINETYDIAESLMEVVSESR